MALQSIEVPDGYQVYYKFYKKKTLDPDYVEIRGRPLKADVEIVMPDRNTCTIKEMKAYYNRMNYIKKKKALVA
jgi:hypothetical protein